MEENLYFIIHRLFDHIPMFIVPVKEFYLWYVAPYKLTVPKLKQILFDYYNIVCLHVKATLVLIPKDFTNHRTVIFFRFVTILQTYKQEFNIVMHKNQDFIDSNSLIWRFYIV